MKGLRSTNHKEVQWATVAVLKQFCGGFANKQLSTSPPLDTVPGWTRKPNVRVGRESAKGDVLIIDHDKNTHTIVDFVITHPYMDSAANKAGVAAQRGHTTKISKYSNRYEMPDYHNALVPAAMETGGRWHPTLRTFISQHIQESISLRADMNEWTAEDKAVYSAHIQAALTTIGVALQRAMARSLLRHVANTATHPPLQAEDVAVAP